MWLHESHPCPKCDSRKRMESYPRQGFDSCIHIESNPRRVFGGYGHFHPILAGFSVDMAIFIQSSAGFRWIWPFSSNPRRVFGGYGHFHPIPAGFSVNMAIFIQSSPGFRWIWPFSSNTRRVFGGYGHIRPILGGFSVDMAIFIQSPAGFACINTNFKSFSPRRGWSQRHTPQNVSGLSVIRLHAEAFVGRMPYVPTRTDENLSRRRMYRGAGMKKRPRRRVSLGLCVPLSVR